MSKDKLKTGEKFIHPNMNKLTCCRDEWFNMSYDEETQQQHLQNSPLRYNVYDKWHGGNYQVENEYKEFVVVDSKWGGGGTGMGPHDVCPDAWQVFCCPVGHPEILIKFHQQNSCYYATINEVELL